MTPPSLRHRLTSVGLPAAAVDALADELVAVSTDAADAGKAIDAHTGRPLAVVSSSHGLLAARPDIAAVADGYLYWATDDNGGTAYQAQGGGWVKLAPRGVELGYAQITSVFTTTANGEPSRVDVPGLSITVTSDGQRPLMLSSFIPIGTHSASGGQVKIFIVEGTTVLTKAVVQAGAAGAGLQLFAAGRVTPSAGAHTYKVQAVGALVAGTVSLFADPTFPAYLQAVEA